MFEINRICMIKSSCSHICSLYENIMQHNLWQYYAVKCSRIKTSTFIKFEKFEIADFESYHTKKGTAILIKKHSDRTMEACYTSEAQLI